MDSPEEKPPLKLDPVARRRIIWVVAASIAIIILGLGVAPMYRTAKAWRGRALAQEADSFLKQKNLPAAATKAQAAFALAPGETAVLRSAARVASAAGSPEALPLWKAVLSRPEATREDRQHAVLTSIWLGQLPFAEEHLRPLLQASPDDLSNLELGIQLALQKNDPAAALSFAERMLARDPARTFARLNRAQVILFNPTLPPLNGSTPLQVLAASLPPVPAIPRPSLEEIRADLRVAANDDPALRVDALHLLIREARRRQQAEEALGYARQLLAGPGWSFEDRFLELDLLAEAKSAELDSAVEETLLAAGAKPDTALAAAGWLLNHQRPQRCLDWLPTLTAEVTRDDVFKLCRAEADAALSRWSEAEKLLQTGPWAHSLELRRRAHLARALREQHQTVESKREWNSLVTDPQTSRPNLTELVRLTEAWQWPEEKEQVLWRLLERFPQEKWVAPVLVNAYLSAGRTADLRRLADLLLEREPESPILKNNAALLAMLVSGRQERSARLAREAYETEPGNSTFACTYAFSMFLEGRKEEAITLMDSLPQDILKNPSTAAYFALFLRQAGNTERAEEYRTVALAGRLLPEEREMLTATFLPR